MSVLRQLFVLTICLALAATVSAQGGKQEKPDHDPLIQAIDKNNDGCMTEEEWRAVGMPMSSFNGLVKDGCVTKEIMMETEGPEGIDLNGDGVLTLEEFLEFDKIMSAKMAQQGGGSGGPPPGGAQEDRPTISAAERALAMLEVQNVFSKHAYYHQVGKHCEEIEDIWVAEDGPNAETARWTLSGSTILQGIAKVKKEYCTDHLESQKKTLEELSKKVPSIKNIPENIGAGSEYVMHTQETPVIEVAGDGKTAKGIWYSIGLAVRGAVDENGDTSVSTGWMWEKYGVDFIKEKGEWKIWHLVNLMDQGPVQSGAQGQAGGPPGGGQGGPPPGGRGGAPGGQAGGGETATEHFSWSPTAVPRIDPPFPEPYYTFSETFSY